jgi:hypothetical protein
MARRCFQQAENSYASWNAELRAEIVPDTSSILSADGKLMHSFWECRTESGNHS